MDLQVAELIGVYTAYHNVLKAVPSRSPLLDETQSAVEAILESFRETVIDTELLNAKLNRLETITENNK